MTKKLLVIIPDRLSVLIQKGEVVSRYYNPCDLFDEVHIMMTNDDMPDPILVQPMAGRAKLYLHNCVQPTHFFRNTLGWQLSLIDNWVSTVLDKVQEIRPHLIRIHNNFLEGYLAARIKQKFHIPYVISLHGAWNVDDLGTFKLKIYRFFRKKLEKIALENADTVICVYSSILEYAKSHGAKNICLIHNFVGMDYIKAKQSWDFKSPIKIITVNRQLPEKNPENIIKAISLLPYNIEYIVVGDGVLHNYLKELAKALGIDKQIKFFKHMPNSQVCKLYSQCDFMVSNCHYKGISKTIIEAGLSGLPIILNSYHDGYNLLEYQGDWIYECADTPEGYAKALKELIENNIKREFLGKQALKVTQQIFSPLELEEKVAGIYKFLLKEVPI